MYIITQNALADGTYLMYIRAHYNKSDQVKYDTPFFQQLLRPASEIRSDYKTNGLARLAGRCDVAHGVGDAMRKTGARVIRTSASDLHAFPAKLRGRRTRCPSF